MQDPPICKPKRPNSPLAITLLDKTQNLCYNGKRGYFTPPEPLKGDDHIKREHWFLYELANILCWFRITASVILAVSRQPSISLAILCSLAFITDVIGGWAYRHFVKTPYKHWSNQLPISLDPLADFAFVMGGVLHFTTTLGEGLFCCLVLAIFVILCNILARHGSDRIYTVFATTLTYAWFIFMLGALIGVWLRSTTGYWWLGVGATLVIFYSLWLNTRVKSRSIRRRR